MNMKRRWLGVGLMGALCASALVAIPGAGRAHGEDHGSGIKLSDLAGSWTVSVAGNTGCGIHAMYVTVDLDATGSGTATIKQNSTGCPPGINPGQVFQITSLNPDGSGTAGLSCGPGCGWAFTIQVPKDDPNLFTVVDVAPENPNNVLVGTAARKWPVRHRS